jgi:hypothetical protein
MSAPRLVQALLWLAFLGVIAGGGHATTYIAPWQHGLVLGTLALLALGALLAWAIPGGHAHDGHDHAPASWSETGVHALPLLLFLAVGPTALGSHALAGASQLDAGGRAAPAASGDGLTDLIALRHEPLLAGGRVELVARLGEIADPTVRRRRGDPPPPLRAVLFRHGISCCAADAQPIYAWLAGERPRDLPLDAWVRVSGTVDARETGGVIPVITAERITAIAAPAEPYLVLPGAVKQHR